MIKKAGKIVLRIPLVSIYAILTLKLVGFARQSGAQFQSTVIPKTVFIFLYVFFFNLNTEGNFYFSKYLNKKLDWSEDLKKRLIKELGFLFIWSIPTIVIPFGVWYIINGMSFSYPPASIIVFISAIVFLLGFTIISIAINFFKQSQKHLLNVEHYKQEKLKSDYRVLQNQVNPHFLFNSLHVLISEIKHDPNTAVDFTRKLSKAYRYVLQSKNHDLISLNKELEFIESFIFLHKVRIGNALDYSLRISDGTKNMKLPPLTLQILIENAIKHNIANEENVLTISISSDGADKLIVKNNLQTIKNVDSTHTGLSNLKKLFGLLHKEGVNYGVIGNQFIVNIPLIDE